MPPERLINLPLIGRDADHRRLRRAVGLDGDAHTPAPQAGGAVLLDGDAGVGKTRLLKELASDARGLGWTVLVGRCLDLGDSAVPYLPIREMIGRLATGSPELADAMTAGNPALARLLPTGGNPVAGAGTAAGDPARVDRAEVLEGVHAGLAALAARAPVLVLVEDMHWADPSSRELVGYLFARPVSGISVVASYRSDDMHRRHPLRGSLAEWGRLPEVTRVHLQPLHEPDMRTLVQALVGRAMPEPALRTIVQRAEGNAFFAEELTAALDGRGPAPANTPGTPALPTDLTEVLLVRLDRLDDRGRRAVRAAAVAGRAVDHELLAAVAGLSDDDLYAALRAAVEGQVLVPERDGYAFRHALLAEAVYDDLLPGERTRLHAAYAATLDRADDCSAAELAYHARAAGDTATAVTASIRAGDDAMTVGGWEESVRHYEVALALAASYRPREADGTPVDLVELTEKASQAAAAAGDVFRAIALVQDQLRQLPDDATPLQRARLLHALGHAAMLADTQIDILQLSGDALDLLPAEPPVRLHAQVLALHARASLDRGRDDAAERWAAEALAIARQHDLVDVIADATLVTAKLSQRAGDPDASLETLTDAVAAARKGADAAAELRSLFHLAGLYYEQARWDEARTAYLAADELAVATGRQWAPYGVEARVLAALVAYNSGDWDVSLRLVDTSEMSPPESAWALLTATGLAVAAGRGERAALDALPLVRPSWKRDGMIAVLTGFAGIDLHGDTGDLDAAVAVHDDVIATLQPMWNEELFQARLRLGALILGQTCAAVRRTGARDHEALVAAGRQHVEVADRVWEGAIARSRRPGPESTAWRARVVAEYARLRWLTGIDAPPEDELVDAWRQSVAAFENLRHVYEAARSSTRLAAVLRATGQADEADTLTESAVATARRLGAEPLLAELAELTGGAAARPPRQRPVSTNLLTSREQEVLALVAQGRSNREIGRQLFISEKTASVHVSHILAKLGARGRTEAVALARERGLLDTAPA